MPLVRVTSILDAEKARLDALLAVTTPAPTSFEQYAIKKTLSAISLMKQQVGEGDVDYSLRVNLEAQRAVPGYWSAGFFAQLDAAIAADTSEGSRGGRGRAD